MSDSQEGLALPPKSNGRPPVAAAASAPRPGATLVTPATPAAPTAAPTPLVTKPVETPAARRPEGHAPIIPTPRRDSEQRRLIVGREICLTGEITSCERLIVEGSVEANLTNCREVEIAESGLFKGAAEIQEADIRGRFEGKLTVKGRLLIRTLRPIGSVSPKSRRLALSPRKQTLRAPA